MHLKSSFNYALYNLTNNCNHSQVIKFIVTLRIVN